MRNWRVARAAKPERVGFQADIEGYFLDFWILGRCARGSEQKPGDCEGEEDNEDDSLSALRLRAQQTQKGQSAADHIC